MTRKLSNQDLDGLANASLPTALLGFDLLRIFVDRRLGSCIAKCGADGVDGRMPPIGNQ